jgi:putative phosphoribosyl transferase
MRAAGLPFADRSAAGQALGLELQHHTLAAPGADVSKLLVLALPRGGVPVAAEVARALSAPLDVLTVRKVGLPEQPELALGAVAAFDVVVRDPLGLLHGRDAGTFEQLAVKERLELKRREQVYRAGCAPLQLAGQTVVLVDDGLATGATMLAAVRAARQGQASQVIVAVPVASPQAVSLLAREADRVIALHAPPELTSVGQWYQDFTQLDDHTVCELLKAARPRPGRA